MTKKKVAIDAGHGIHTPGKRSPDGALREFNFNAPVARHVADMLAEYQDVETLFVHDTSGLIDVPLRERTNAAHLWGADIFVSIHANAFGSGWNDANGIETFVAKTSVGVREIEAVRLARVVQRSLVAATGRRNRGVKSEDFYVLRQTTMPAILVECGFMTNREEAALLMSDEYRRTCARAIVNGIAEAYGMKKRKQEANEDMSALAAVAELEKRIQELEQKAERVEAPDWFVQEFGSADLNGAIHEPRFTLEGWRVLAIGLRVAKFQYFS